MQNTDYYALLGVDRASAPEEITRAYRRLARQYHPDVNPHDAEAGKRFAGINEAYQVLSDPEKRAQYDLQRATSQSPWQAGSAAGPSQAEQAVADQQPVVVHWDDIKGDVGDLAAPLQEVANQAADELREVLRDFGAELNSILRTFGNPAGDRTGRQGFPPPPPRDGRPPRGGRPPQGGRAPKP